MEFQSKTYNAFLLLGTEENGNKLAINTPFLPQRSISNTL